MKKLLFGIVLASAIMSCTGNEPAEEQLTETQKQEVLELENVTNEVTDGIEQMTEKVDELGSEVDELLNDI